METTTKPAAATSFKPQWRKTKNKMKARKDDRCRETTAGRPSGAAKPTKLTTESRTNSNVADKTLKSDVKKSAMGDDNDQQQNTSTTTALGVASCGGGGALPIPAVHNMTREEECCFKTALALVIVKKRLASKSLVVEKPGHDQNGSTASKRSKTHVTPSMQALLFPPCNSNGSVLTKNDQHIATMYATALRTASILCGENSEQQPRKHLWATLEGLASHLSHQLSIALKHPVQSNQTLEDLATSVDQNWVEIWMLNLLSELWHGSASSTTTNKTKNDAETIQKTVATFALWRAILLEQSGSLKDQSPIAKIRSCEVAGAFATVLERLIQIALHGGSLRLEPTNNSRDEDGSVGNSWLLSQDSSAATKTSPLPSLIYAQTQPKDCTHHSRDALVVQGLQLLQALSNVTTNNKSGPVLPWKTPPQQCMVPQSDVTQWYGRQTARVRRGGRSVSSNNSCLDPGAQLMTMVALYQAYGEKHHGPFPINQLCGLVDAQY